MQNRNDIHSTGQLKQAAAILSKAPLFDGILREELESLLLCLGASFRTYVKGQYLISAGDTVSSIGIVMSGIVDVVKEDVLGRRSIVNKIGPLEMFAEAIVCAGITVSPVSVQSLSDLRICYIDYGKIVRSCSSACGFHSRLIQNMLHILALKAIIFNKKLDYLLIKGMRERLTAYLLDQSDKSKSLEFKIPFNREEMADFLAVDRSAMSRELGKMRREGLIDFNKSRFVIFDKEKLSQG